jgi:hypothetical protein
LDFPEKVGPKTPISVFVVRSIARTKPGWVRSEYTTISSADVMNVLINRRVRELDLGAEAAAVKASATALM